MKRDYEPAEIIDDSSSDEEYVLPKPAKADLPKPAKADLPKPAKADLPKPAKADLPKPAKAKSQKHILKGWHNNDDRVAEIGVDEVGRGPLFGRVYTAAVILPKDGTFDFTQVKDSKKYHSKKKIEEAAEYVKQHALAWHVSYEDEAKIDEVNILQATQLSMHASIDGAQDAFNRRMNSLGKRERTDYTFSLLIDGNYFKPKTCFNTTTQTFESTPYMTVESGDNTYASIAAASILAKVARDQYIDTLCEAYTDLNEHYGIQSNKGYGAKRHMDGIKEHGITIWHRRSFAPCKYYV